MTVIKTKTQKLKLDRQTIATLSSKSLELVQGAGPTQTRGVGCEPSGILACE
jgi:nitrogenase subunit NifH